MRDRNRRRRANGIASIGSMQSLPSLLQDLALIAAVMTMYRQGLPLPS
jgi:hypothetical protein